MEDLTPREKIARGLAVSNYNHSQERLLMEVVGRLRALRDSNRGTIPEHVMASIEWALVAPSVLHILEALEVAVRWLSDSP